MTIERYLAHRRAWEFAIAGTLVLVSFLANLGVVWIEFSRDGDPFPAWLPAVLEGTSHVGLALVVPLIIRFDGRFPIGTDTWRVSLPAHAVFSVVASLVHTVLMYWGRVLIFPRFADGWHYHWDNWLGQWGYEYLKDFRTYILIIAFLYLYRFVIRRLQGEAGFVGEGQDEQPDAPLSDRFLVKKLGREFLVRVRDIEWIEAAGNYVNLHVSGRVYPLRDTMASIGDKLSPQGFQRVHRSAIVNLDSIAEIIAYDTGDGEARLNSDVRVPVSRRYRKELRERLG